MGLFFLFYGSAFFVWATIYGDDYATAQDLVYGAPKVVLVSIAVFFTWLWMRMRRPTKTPLEAGEDSG